MSLLWPANKPFANMKPSALPVPGKWKLINFLVLLFIVTCPSQAFSQHKTRKTVFIIADGIPADVIEKLPVPNLKAIAKAGGYTRSYVGGVKGTYSQTPTISAVGYNSVL